MSDPRKPRGLPVRFDGDDAVFLDSLGNVAARMATERMTESSKNADVSVSPEPRAGEKHPELQGVRARVRYIVKLMAERRWVRGQTGPELAAAWGLSLTLVENYSTEASRALELLGDREAVLELVRAHAVEWLEQSDNDRVQTARLLVDTVGGFSQRHEVTVSAKPHTREEVAADCVAWLKEHAPEALLTAADEVRGLLLTEGTET